MGRGEPGHVELQTRVLWEGGGGEGDQEPAELAGQDLSVLLSTLAFPVQSASPHFSLQMKGVLLEPGHCCFLAPHFMFGTEGALSQSCVDSSCACFPFKPFSTQQMK